MATCPSCGKYEDCCHEYDEDAGYDVAQRAIDALYASAMSKLTPDEIEVLRTVGLPKEKHLTNSK